MSSEDRLELARDEHRRRLRAAERRQKDRIRAGLDLLPDVAREERRLMAIEAELRKVA